MNSLHKIMRSIRVFVFGLWNNPRKAQDTSAPKNKTSKKKPIYNKESNGQWYFRRDILDRLEDYFICIKRMRRVDPEAYALFSKVGAVVVSPKMAVGIRGKNSANKEWGHLEFVGFGAVALVGHDEDDDFDKTPAKFLYFRKADIVPAEVEPTNETVYQVTVFWTSSKKTDLSIPAEYYVGIGKNVRILKQRTVNLQELPKRRNQKAGYVPHIQWTYPKWLKDMKPEKGNANQWALDIFDIAYNGYMQASSGVRIRAEKCGSVATFCVDLLRMPYFFNDRDFTANEKGSRQRIFHIVRTHKRNLSNGSTTFVKSHFRGSRHFIWNGHKITVTMPGKHHADLLDLPVGFHKAEDGAHFPDTISSKGVGRLIDRHINV